MHLGAPNFEQSLVREKIFVEWLTKIQSDAAEIYLLGDIFDFWFEWRHAIPRGYTRFLGKLAEICDSGIPVHFFTGNHDMWAFDYLPKEIGVTMYRKPISKEISGKKFFIGHGDGLGPNDRKYKFLKKVFSCKFLQWCFARIHPNFGIGVANFWSRKSRLMHPVKHYRGNTKEWLFIYAEQILQQQYFDYFIFGHRHLPLDIEVTEKSRYINLGDWISNFTYAEFDGNDITLKYYKQL